MFEPYKNDMDRIEVHPKLRQQVLDAVEEMETEPKTPQKSPFAQRRSLSPLLAAASLVVVLGLSLFARGLLTGGPGPGITEHPPEDGMVILENNPVDLHATEEDALESLSFSALRPTFLPEGYSQSKTTTVSGSLLTLEYRNPQGQRLVLRMAPGEGDISGVHETFPSEERLPRDTGELLLRMRGDDVHVALWTLPGTTVSLYSEDGLSEEDVIKILDGLIF